MSVMLETENVAWINVSTSSDNISMIFQLLSTIQRIIKLQAYIIITITGGQIEVL